MILSGRCRFWSYSEGVNGKGKPWLRVCLASDDALIPCFVDDKSIETVSDIVKSLQLSDEIDVTVNVYVFDGKVGLRLCGIAM